MARGAALGVQKSLVGAGDTQGISILLAPVLVIVGTVAGAVSAEPAAKVEDNEAAFRVAMEELKVPETFRRCVADRLPERTSRPGGLVSSDEPASTILEVEVEQVGLDGPPLRFVLTERTRLIRASDGTKLYGHRLTYRGQPRPLDDWLSQNGARLREEAARACRELAERLVEEVFLLYLPDGGRRDAQ